MRGQAFGLTLFNKIFSSSRLFLLLQIFKHLIFLWTAINTTELKPEKLRYKQRTSLKLVKEYYVCLFLEICPM